MVPQIDRKWTSEDEAIFMLVDDARECSTVEFMDGDFG